jgi:hypothetical protein
MIHDVDTGVEAAMAGTPYALKAVQVRKVD